MLINFLLLLLEFLIEFKIQKSPCFNFAYHHLKLQLIIILLCKTILKLIEFWKKKENTLLILLRKLLNQWIFEERSNIFLIQTVKLLSPYPSSKTDSLIFKVYNLKASEISSSSHFFSYTKVLLIASRVIDHADGERTAWAFCDILAFGDVEKGYLKFISTGTWIVEGPVLWLKVKIFYFDFVVNLSRHSRQQL